MLLYLHIWSVALTIVHGSNQLCIGQICSTVPQIPQAVNPLARSSLGTLTNDVRLTGSNNETSLNNEFTIVISPLDPIAIGPGGILSLNNVTLSNVSLAYGGSTAASASDLRIQGIEWDPARSDTIVTLRQCTLQLSSCDQWSDLFTALCDNGEVDGMIQVTHNMITIATLNTSNYQWSDVMISYGSSCPTMESSSGCAIASLPGYFSHVEWHTTFVWFATSMLREHTTKYFIVMPDHAYGIPESFVFVNLVNMTLQGIGAFPHADVELTNQIWNVKGNGVVNMRNFAAFNLPSIPVNQYILYVRDAVMVLPDEELHYLDALLFSNGSLSTTSWLTGPQGPIKPGLIASKNPDGSLLLSSIEGKDHSWIYLNVTLTDSRFKSVIKQRIKWRASMEEALLLPGETIQSFDLSSVTPLASPLSLSLLAYSDPDFVSEAGDVNRFVLSKGILLDAISPTSDYLKIQTTTLVAGDPTSSNQTVLDFNGLPSHASGIISVCSSDASSDCALHLRSLTLVNLQPSDLHYSTLSQDGTLQILRSFASMLWLFDIPRLNTSSEPRVILADVTLVLPPVELQILRDLINDVFPGGSVLTIKDRVITGNTPGIQLLLNQLRGIRAVAKMLGNDKNLSSLPDLPVTSDLKDEVPGDVVIPQYLWFGVAGVNVTWTCVTPHDMVGPMLPIPISQRISPDWISQNLTGSKEANNSTEESSQALSPWKIGLIVALSVSGSLGLLGICLWAWSITQMRRDSHHKTSMKSPIKSSEPNYANTQVDMGERDDLEGNPNFINMDEKIETLTPSSSNIRGSGSKVISEIGPEISRCTSTKLLPDTAATPIFVSMCEEIVVPSLLSDPSANTASTSELAYEEILRSPVKIKTLSVEIKPSLNEILPVEKPMSSLIAWCDTPKKSKSEEGSIVNADVENMDCVPLKTLLSLVEKEFLDSKGKWEGCKSKLDMRNLMHQEIVDIKESVLGCKSQAHIMWSIEKELGRGSSGVVYKGTWRELTVAIKRIIFQVVGDQGNREEYTKILQEANINAGLSHPNVVATYDFGIQQMKADHDQGNMSGLTDWQFVIIQELCDKGTLALALQQGSFKPALSMVASALPPTTGVSDPIASALSPVAGVSAPSALPSHESAPSALPSHESVSGPSALSLEEEANGQGVSMSLSGNSGPSIDFLGVAIDIASGLSYIHSQQLIHGDIKPENVLLKTCVPREGKVVAKVADFGMSSTLNANRTHVSGVFGGTTFYIAPEILHKGTASKASDIYSLGIILWELYHGVLASQHVQEACKLNFQAYLCYSSLDYDDLPTEAPQWAHHYVHLGRSCLSEDPSQRPTIDQIIKTLSDIRSDIYLKIISNSEDILLTEAPEQTRMELKQNQGGGEEISHITIPGIRKKLEPLAPQSGEVILGNVLATGTQGTVYMGTWRNLDVAIKVVECHDNDQDMKIRAVQEAAVCSTLVHPNVVSTFDYSFKPRKVLYHDQFEEEPVIWELTLVQELCNASLSYGIEAKFFHSDDGCPCYHLVIPVFWDMAMGIDFIHSKGIVHGDIKPENVLLKLNSSPRGMAAKVTDFGLSWALPPPQSHVSTDLGTMFYKAPEGKISKRSDVYSFGILMIELIKRESPYVLQSGQLRENECFLEVDPMYMEGCPDRLLDLILSCINHDPLKRPSFLSIKSSLRAVALNLQPPLVL